MKVYEDVHGLYVKTNGGIYRPIMSVYCYAIQPYFHTNILDSKHKKDDNIKGGSSSGTPFAKVGDEIWCLHGSYDKKPFPFNPK